MSRRVDRILVRVSCPVCGREIPERFARFAPPFMLTCKEGHRLVVTLNPEGPGRHRVERVPPGETMETVVRRRMTSTDLMDRARAIGAFVAQGLKDGGSQ